LRAGETAETQVHVTPREKTIMWMTTRAE